MPKQAAIRVALAITVATAVWLISSPTIAQSERRGAGPGMMYGQNYGPGMMGYGPGMMYGPGYGRRGAGFGPGMMGGCSMWGTDDGSTSAFIEGRIAFLKAELKITDNQQTAWQAYAEAVKNNLQSMQGMWQSMRASFEADALVERLDARIAAMESRVSALKAVKPALANLYSVLSTDQKKKADDLLTSVGCMM